MKGQVSTELLVIVALVLLVFIPLLVLVYFKASEANQQIASYQAELAVFRVASLANSVGSLGTNTSVSTDVFIPPNTESLIVSRSGRGGEITLTISSPQGSTEIVEIIKYPVKGTVELADETTAGTWTRLKITSEYVGNEATISIKKVS